MQAIRSDPLPLYQQIKVQFREKIESGEWAVGHTIPAETEFARHMQVSRTTVRQAIMELVREGYLYRIQGKGTVITKPKVEPVAALSSFTENMRASGIEPSHKVLAVTWVEPPPDIAEFFSQNSVVGKRVLYIHRLMLADGEPLSIQKAYLPEWLIQDKREFFTLRHLEGHSLYELLERECKVALWRADELLDVSTLREDEARLLGIEPGLPVMVIQRYTYDRSEKPVEYVKHIFPADRYRYKVTMFRMPQARPGGTQ